MEQQEQRIKFSHASTDDEKARRFKSGGQIAMGSFLIGGIFQILWMSFTPRILGPEGMKLFGEMMGLFYCLGPLISLGAPQAITTFVSQHCENDPAEAEKYLSDGNKLILLLGLGSLAATAVFGGIGVALGFVSVFWYVMSLTLVFSCFVMIVFWGYNSVLNGYHRVDYSSIGNLVFPVGQLGGTVVLALAAKKAFGDGSDWMVTGAIAGMGIGQFFALLTAMAICIRKKMATPADLLDLRTHNGLYMKMLTFGGLSAVALVTATVVQNFTAPLLGLVNAAWPAFTKAEMGFFNTSLIFALSPMLIVGVGIAIIPAMSEAHGQGRRDMMQTYYGSALQQCFSILAVFVTAYALFIGKISTLMNGPKFPEAIMGPLCFRMVIGGAAISMFFVLMNMFIGLKRPAVPAVITILMFLGQIAGITAATVLTKDIMWVTAGFSVPAVIGCAAMFVVAQFSVGLKFPAWTLLEPVACALPAWALVKFGLPHLIDQSAMPFLGAGLAVMLAAYALPMWLLERRRPKPAPAAAA